MSKVMKRCSKADFGKFQRITNMSQKGRRVARNRLGDVSAIMQNCGSVVPSGDFGDHHNEPNVMEGRSKSEPSA